MGLFKKRQKMPTHIVNAKFNRTGAFLATLEDPIEDSIILADMRERVRLFGTTPLRFV